MQTGKQLTRAICRAFLVFMFSASIVLASSAPTVLEEQLENDWGHPFVRYTVNNPAQSAVGDIVAFAIEMAAVPWGGMSSFDDWSGTWLSGEQAWYQPMYGNGQLTWSELFGGIVYPFNNPGTVAIAVWHLPFFEILEPGQSPGDSMEFRFGYTWQDEIYPAQSPISPGQTENRFFAELIGVLSDFVVAHVPDIDTAAFSTAEPLDVYQGEAIPEPATLMLIAFGGLLIRRRR
ncbi:MAG: PEP-CTERM sorting domain-containing protein [Phycisphaerae bacterium]